MFPLVVSSVRCRFFSSFMAVAIATAVGGEEEEVDVVAEAMAVLKCFGSGYE